MRTVTTKAEELLEYVVGTLTVEVENHVLISGHSRIVLSKTSIPGQKNETAKAGRRKVKFSGKRSACST